MSSPRAILVLQMSLVVLIGTVAASGNGLYRKRPHAEPRSLVLGSTRSRWQTGCAVWCSQRSDCLTFSFRPDTQECSLFTMETGAEGMVLFSDSNTVSYLRDDVWEMIFKISKNTEESAFDLWSGTGRTFNDDNCNYSPSQICNTNFKSNRVDSWEYVNEVMMQMIETGAVVAYANFEAKSTDKMTWLNVSRLQGSAWNDITGYATVQNTTISVAGIQGLFGGNNGMSVRFAMNSALGCRFCDDGGWMHVLDIGGDRDVDMCNVPFEGATGPFLRYSKLPGRTILLADPNGIFNTFGSSRTRYSTLHSDYAATCASFGTSVITREELDASRQSGLTCCNCGWTTASTTQAYYPMAEDSASLGLCGSGSGLMACGWSSQYNSWCKNDISAIGEADTMVIYVR